MKNYGFKMMACIMAAVVISGSLSAGNVIQAAGRTISDRVPDVIRIDTDYSRAEPEKEDVAQPEDEAIKPDVAEAEDDAAESDKNVEPEDDVENPDKNADPEDEATEPDKTVPEDEDRKSVV